MKTLFNEVANLTNNFAANRISLLNSQIKGSKTINDAFKIYNQIQEEKNHLPVNCMLKLFVNTCKPHKILQCWSDIDLLITKKQSNEISYNLIIQCLIESKHINKCILILKCMYKQQINYKLIFYDYLIIKLIKQCNQNQIEHIKDLFDQKLIENDSKYIKSELLKSFVNNKCNNNAL
eukprot:190425_1